MAARAAESPDRPGEGAGGCRAPVWRDGVRLEELPEISPVLPAQGVSGGAASRSLLEASPFDVQPGQRPGLELISQRTAVVQIVARQAAARPDDLPAPARVPLGDLRFGEGRTVPLKGISQAQSLHRLEW